jgi:ABC-type branched-subunit amino acid transport system permease subunit
MLFFTYTGAISLALLVFESLREWGAPDWVVYPIGLAMALGIGFLLSRWTERLRDE